MKFKGFTLAEVLITLMIIGIVAALTIPSVISNYQQQEFKTGLKKAVSVLNEAIQTNIAQEGETPYENDDLFSYLQRHMSIIKTQKTSHCFNTTTGELIKLEDDVKSCGSLGGAAFNNAFYTTDGMRYEIPQNHNTGKPLYLHEININIVNNKESHEPYCVHPGYCVYTSKTSGWCGSYGLNTNYNNTKNTPCVIIVDINGDKKPNPPTAFQDEWIEEYSVPGVGVIKNINPSNENFEYTYPSPTDKKLQDIFTIMITDEKAIPFGVVAQRAMYSK